MNGKRENTKPQEKGRGLLAATIAMAALGLVAWAIVAGGKSERTQARIDLEYARASAYVERAAANEARRENAHERVLEMLPMLVIAGAGTLAILGGLGLWVAMKQRAPSTDQALILYLERLRLEQQQRDRALWQALASIERRALTGGESVIIYDERGWDGGK